MRGYFEKMTPVGRGLQGSEREQGAPNAQEIAKVEQEVALALERRKETGLPAERIHKRGEKTAWERIEELVDPGTFQSLNSLYDPEFNQEGTTGVVSGIGQISGSRASESMCFGPRILQSGCVFPLSGYSTAVALSSLNRRRYTPGEDQGEERSFDIVS